MRHLVAVGDVGDPAQLVGRRDAAAHPRDRRENVPSFWMFAWTRSLMNRAWRSSRWRFSLHLRDEVGEARLAGAAVAAGAARRRQLATPTPGRARARPRRAARASACGTGTGTRAPRPRRRARASAARSTSGLHEPQPAPARVDGDDLLRRARARRRGSRRRSSPLQTPLQLQTCAVSGRSAAVASPRLAQQRRARRAPPRAVRTASSSSSWPRMSPISTAPAARPSASQTSLRYVPAAVSAATTSRAPVGVADRRPGRRPSP